MRRALKSAALALITTGAIAGCGDEASELSASSSCRDYLAASADDRSAALAQAAEKRGIGGASSPLGSANVDYICSQDPDVRLGDAVAGSGTQQSTPPSEQAATEETEAAPPIPEPVAIRTDDGYTGEIAFLELEYMTEGVPPPLFQPVATFRLTNTSDRSAQALLLQLAAAPRIEIPRAAFKGNACPDANGEVEGGLGGSDEAHLPGACSIETMEYGVSASTIDAGEAIDIEMAAKFFTTAEPDIDEIRIYVAGRRLATE
ncbi:MAG TPA: hypothetical protein VN238_05975 [Solirubrobacteraceae bacterium]|nr:hypothetical protein [Solirubrobacteraceae bacterium]